MKKTIPFTNALKRIKYIGINIRKEVKDLYTEHYKTMMKKLKTQIMERYSVLMDWKNYYRQNIHTTQSNLQI